MTNQVLEQKSIEELKKELECTQAELARQEQLVHTLRMDIAQLLGSTSWRITAPLRVAKRASQLLARHGLLLFTHKLIKHLFRQRTTPPRFKATLPKESSRKLSLYFPSFTKPEVSIVIPVFNKSSFTWHCLNAVLNNTDHSIKFEVIVVDDCSDDDTQEMLRRMKNIKIVRNEKNLGFILSCNAGAKAAEGDFLLLLNNDTEVQRNWLAPMVNTFKTHSDCGMVGAKLLYADGRLQEAGGIVWQDGSAWNYGRLDDPNKPEYSYLRAVDYCSGACLLVHRENYLSLGGFDVHYLPAYYEDTDLAFRIREQGRQVYYQPLSRVIHFEGVSNGTDTTSGVKEYQQINAEKFFLRWKNKLSTHRRNGENAELEKERDYSKRILVMDHYIPTPDRDSGSLRMFNLLMILRDIGYKVVFFPDNLAYMERYTQALQSAGIECLYGPYVRSMQEHLETHGSSYNAVLLSRADFADKHMSTVLALCPNARVLFDTVDLHFLREEREAKINGDSNKLKQAALRKAQEIRLARAANVTLVVSPLEIELFKSEAPDVNVALLSNIHEVEGCAKGYSERQNILFIGSFHHPPNIDAMHWFIDEIFPLILQSEPEMKLVIIGDGAPVALTEKASDAIIFTGFVENISKYFDNIRLTVAPLRYGAGVKGKVNSSMSHGVPVIATDIAAEGMGLVDGVDIKLAQSAEDFAAALLEVYQDAEQWQRLSDGGIENIKNHFSVRVAKEQIKEILQV
jgi:GT2 family glycosyltransferase